MKEVCVGYKNKIIQLGYTMLFRKINSRQKTGYIDHNNNMEPLISMTTDGA